MGRYHNEITILRCLRNFSTERAVSKIGIAGYLVFPDFLRQSLERVFDPSTMPDDGAARIRTPEVVNRIRFLVNMQQC